MVHVPEGLASHYTLKSLTQLSVAVKQVSQEHLSVADGELYVEILDAKMSLSFYSDVFS